jgi:general secretion pathway protein E
MGLMKQLYVEKSKFEALVIQSLVGEDANRSSELAKIQAGLANSPISLAESLIRSGLSEEDDLYKHIANVTDLVLVKNIADCPDASEVIKATASLDLSVDWCNNSGIYLSIKDNTAKVYVSDPTTKFELDVLLATLAKYTLQCYILTPTMRANISYNIEAELAVSELFGNNPSDSVALAEEAPVINLVNNIIDRAVQAEASDIHIEGGLNNMIVRFRVDGQMHEYMKQPMARFSAISSRIKLLAELDIAERRLPQDGRFSTRADGQEYDVRVSTAPDVHGESIVMRMLPKQRTELHVENLGFQDDHLDMIKSWGKLSNGIVLVTGPTGSGKSTTLYGLLDHIKSGKEKIITVEDPVEYKLEGITQVQAREDIGYTFSRALRAFLRQDPDIIMVGEIRDKETADISIQSALTGHLVLSTLHTNDACSVFPRLSDIGVESYLVAATVQGVQAQRLLRKLCSTCSSVSAPPSFIESNIKGDWRKPNGCHDCQGKGYRGRIGVYEMISITPEMRELIVKKAPVAEMRALSKAQGNRSLFDDGMLKAAKGLTSVEEVLRVCGIGAQ